MSHIRRLDEVHPRVCGGARRRRSLTCCGWGPSPRVRGSLLRAVVLCIHGRSIPACAGEPAAPRRRAGPAGVHPRVCGGARSPSSSRRPGQGPSPRVRGSPTLYKTGAPRSGSIPACAGEPTRHPRGESDDGVHPRVCGGADYRRDSDPVGEGPSPRVRGSRRLRPDPGAGRGSIPACAGEPNPLQAATLRVEVHPRVCGGARRSIPGILPAKGPSPRVRGSPSSRSPTGERIGSIPACAGEPATWCRNSARSTVHPRVCGGAPVARPRLTATMGPSPRVRGSHHEIPRCPRLDGSIPACAGEPARCRPPRRPAKVHPRVCGGARVRHADARPDGGPSPRVRGSPPYEALGIAYVGSIPACAGEPRRRSSATRPCGVHPRVCGGASSPSNFAQASAGPSPRVRGSRPRPALQRVNIGSIPACAGEPPWLDPA